MHRAELPPGDPFYLFIHFENIVSNDDENLGGIVIRVENIFFGILLFGLR